MKKRDVGELAGFNRASRGNNFVWQKIVEIKEN